MVIMKFNQLYLTSSNERIMTDLGAYKLIGVPEAKYRPECLVSKSLAQGILGGKKTFFKLADWTAQTVRHL